MQPFKLNIETAADKAAKHQLQLCEAVNTERARRVEIGAVINGIPVQGREVDKANLMARYNVAKEKKAAGDNSASIVFRDGSDIVHSLTPDEMIALYLGSIQFAEDVYKASWALKDNGDVPEDFASDIYWP